MLTTLRRRFTTPPAHLRRWAEIRGNEDLDLVHDRQAAVGRREKAHSPLVHARHDERVVRDQAESPLVAEAPEHRRLGHRDDLDPIAGMA